MPFLIDGDNLLGTWPGRRRSDAERRRLAFEIGRHGSSRRRRMVVVFDGTAPPGLVLGPDVHFAGLGRSADELMLEILRREANPRGWIVVTSDRSLADQCRYLHARTERSDVFRKQLTAEGAEEKPEAEDDVEYWLRQFGEDD